MTLIVMDKFEVVTPSAMMVVWMFIKIGNVFSLKRKKPIWLKKTTILFPMRI